MTFETETVPIRVCQRCGAEFQPHVLECLDCGAATEAAWEGSFDERPRKRPETPAEPEGHRSIVSPGARPPELSAALTPTVIEAIRVVAERLERDGIRFHVEEQDKSRGLIFVIWVSDEDTDRAVAIEREVLREKYPEDFVASDTYDPTVCPCCETRLAPGVLDCPECGLQVGLPEEMRD